MSDRVDSSDEAVEGLETAPEIFVEGFRGAYFRAGLIKLNFFSNQVRGQATIHKRAVLTLTVPVADLREIVPALQELLDGVDGLAGDTKELQP